MRALAVNLRARNYVVDLADNGTHTLQIAANHPPDAVIVDLGLPGISGLEVVRGLHGWTETPIIVLSAREAEADKVAALDAGADDYVTKPFGINELLARLRAALRHSTPSAEEPVITTPHFVVDLAAKRVQTNDGEIRLTPTEWHVVEVLVRNAGRLVTGRKLVHDVWGPNYGDDTNSLRVHLANIRRKLEPDPAHPRYFVTDPGMGFRFFIPDE